MEITATNTMTTTAPSMWQKLMLNMVAKMNKGQLTIKFPNGSEQIMGDHRSKHHAQITINDEAFFKQCILYGDIGFGEAYVDGLWDTEDIATFISWVLLNIDTTPMVSGSKISAWSMNLLKFVNRMAYLNRGNSKAGSKKNIQEHYDLSNDFFAEMLDETMTYSSAYFTDPTVSLEEAQLEKYQMLASRVKLKATDHVLEIGTGWGGNALFMAKNYDCLVTTVTISEAQYEWATRRVKEEHLDHKITVLLKDYRELTGTYDKIVSIEMLEAVGHKYLNAYFKQCHALLKKEGLLGLQVITCPDSRYASLKQGVDWIQKHIFPGSLLPSVGAINDAVNKSGNMTLVNVEDFGTHYAETLHQWHDRFNANWDKIVPMGFDNRFRRKWNYYLKYCEAAFAMRNINLLQMVYTRPNNMNW